MSIPYIPLLDIFSYLAEFNVHWSQAIVIIAAFVFFGCFYINTASGYDKVLARVGFWALIAAIFISVVGIVYPLVLIVSILILYVLVRWVIWAFLIKNIIVAFTPDKPKDPKAKE